MSNEVIFDTRKWVWGRYISEPRQSGENPSSDEVSLSHDRVKVSL